MKFTAIIMAVALAASSTSAFAMGGYEPEEIWVHPKLPAAKVFDFGGIATDNAFIEAKYTAETIKGLGGMAYAFKKGCDPAPYYVEGYDQGAEIVTLKGKAPIRKGCEVIGYTEDSPNAKLEFVFFD